MKNFQRLLNKYRYTMREMTEVARKAKVTNFKAYKRMRNLKKMKKYSPWVLSMVLFFAIIGVCYVFRDRIIAPATTFYSNFIKENYQQVVVGMSNTAP